MRLKENKLRNRISSTLLFLFEELGARFVANDEETRPKYHIEVATFELENLRFKAVSARDGFYTEIAPKHSPREWEEIGTVLEAIDAKPVGNYLPLSQFAPLLKARLPDLQKALSESNYPVTKEIVQKLKQIHRDEYNQHANQTAQFYRDHPESNPWNKKEQIARLRIED